MTRAGLIGANEDVLVTIAGAVKSSQRAESVAFSDYSEELDRFRNQSSIVITLESVAFSDGSTAGRDASGALKQIAARIRSEVELYSEVASKGNTGPTFVPWLRTIASQLAPGMNLKNLGSDPYPQWYRFYQAKLAGQLAQLADARGVDAVVAQARSMLEARYYPSLNLNP
jgi:hypothetical protein